jgi:hypothetical protein|tara:strand:+ start:292 stop:735 length:444 start_codon:yes stop_codon:yes gene_type:complete
MARKDYDVPLDKLNVEEYREILEFIADCYAFRKRKGEIKRKVREQLECEINPFVMEWLLKEGRKIHAEAGQKTREEHRQESIDFLRQIIADDKSTIIAKLRAQDQLTTITGLEARFFGTDLEDPDSIAQQARTALKLMDDDEVDPVV